MFRALRRSSSGAPTVFAASDLHTRVAANTVGAPDDERRNARNMLSF